MIKIKKIAALLTAGMLAFFTAACNGPVPFGGAGEDGSRANADEERARFDEYLEEDFVATLESDLLTLHYTLKDPAAYGIEDVEPTFGDVQPPLLSDYDEEIDRLEGFDRSLLTKEQQELYEMLMRFYRQERGALEQGYAYYSEPCAPDGGVQASLPITLSEYQFYTEQDVRDYIALLGDVGRYYDDLVKYEEERARRGLFMTDDMVDQVIEDCRTFIANPEQNVLIATFETRLDALDSLDEQARADYIKQNHAAVMDTVIPAYERMMEGLEKLKGTGVNPGGLSHLEKGKGYYEYLARSLTGVDAAPDELARRIDERFGELFSRMFLLLGEDETSERLISEMEAFLEADRGTPREQIDFLHAASEGIFPDAGDISYNVLYVDPSLEDSTAPAFYMIPPADAPAENRLYINQGRDSGTILYATLAHEAYPGHMYQNNYFISTGPAMLRHLLSYMGYSEGWGTYAELYSYELAGLDDPALIELLQINNEFSLGVLARSDIGIHYQGWTVEQFAAYLDGFGFDTSDAEDFYWMIVADPGAYLPYYIGYLELIDIIDDARIQLGDQFDILAVHKAILDAGPQPFDMVRAHVQEYVDRVRGTQASGSPAQAA